MSGGDTSLGEGGREFPNTTWGLVRGLQESAALRQRGLETLCRRYWRPIYSFVRRAWRKSNEDAKDLTQAFFTWLVEARVLKRYQPEVGPFRQYLKGLLRNFVRNHEQALARLKRGGAARLVSLDEELAGLAETVPDDRVESPEEAFDRAWVGALIERGTERVRQGCLEAGQGLRFRVFEEYELAPPGAQPTYAQVAERLGLSPGDVKNHLFAVRERLRAEIRSELRETVADPRQLEEEWRALFC